MIRQLIGKETLDHKVYSVAALNAFANTKNEDRKLSTEQSLENISNNLVEIIMREGKISYKGSGLMVATSGYVLTAHHVAEHMKKGSKGFVKTQRGLEYEIKSDDVWYNNETDVAIVKAKTPREYARPAKIKVNLDGKIKRGDEIRILGFRDGQKYNTMGMVTRTGITQNLDGHNVHDLFETDARGKQGQSGGVIVNSQGELVGIVVYSSRSPCEDIGVIGGAKISHAMKYINQIAALESAILF